MRRFIGMVAGAAIIAFASAAAAADYKIMAPAGPGGGWDQTGRSLEQAMKASNLVRSVQITNKGGAGGVVGLPEFLNQWRGRPNAIMVAGLVMVGSIITNKAPVTLLSATPLARLTEEYQVVVAPANSPFKDLKDFAAALKADPAKVPIAGGGAGGTDHITAGLIAKAIGVDPTKINYVAFSGGGEALAAILGNQVTVGISGYGEFAEQVKAGTMRLLAISAPEKVAGIDAPTLKESGVDVAIQNWRMVAAAPGITAEQEAAIRADVEKMVNSASWQKILADKGWANTYLAGDDFKAQLAQDIAATSAILKDIGLVQ